MSQLYPYHHTRIQNIHQCDVGGWLQSRRLVSQTKSSLLASNALKIFECLGGIDKCLMLLLNNRSLLTTIQLMQLNHVLTDINQEEKTKNKDKYSQTHPETNVEHVTDEDTNPCIEFIHIPSQCIKYITTFLTIPEIKPFNNVCSTFAIIGSDEAKKTNSYHLNGHSLIIKHKNQINKNQYINVIDIGFETHLVQTRTFKDESLLHVFQNMSETTHIPLQYLSIFSYTVRNNGTTRPNRRICLDFNEDIHEMNDNVNGFITEEMKISHTIPTTPNLRIKNITSIHEFIGNVKPKYRKFLLLDRREIDVVDEDNGSNPILICLKFFDIVTQTLYFTHWVYVYDHGTTVRDLAVFIECKLLCDESSDVCRYYFKECVKYMKRMKKMERNMNVKENHLMLFEECDSGQGHIFHLAYDKQIYDEFRDGDIFVFQLNPYHVYFRNHSIQFMIESSFHQSHASIYKTFNDFMISMSQ
eukprot:411402_1